MALSEAQGSALLVLLEAPSKQAAAVTPARHQPRPRPRPQPQPQPQAANPSLSASLSASRILSRCRSTRPSPRPLQAGGGRVLLQLLPRASRRGPHRRGACLRDRRVPWPLDTARRGATTARGRRADREGALRRRFRRADRGALPCRLPQQPTSAAHQGAARAGASEARASPRTRPPVHPRTHSAPALSLAPPRHTHSGGALSQGRVARREPRGRKCLVDAAARCV